MSDGFSDDGTFGHPDDPGFTADDYAEIAAIGDAIRYEPAVDNRDLNDDFVQYGSDAVRDALGKATRPPGDKSDGLPMRTLDLAALSKIDPSAKRFAIERIAPLGEVTLFTGAGSAGKSLLAQQLSTAAAAGVQCLGMGVQPAVAVYVTCEDDADELHWRQAHICRALGVDMAALAGRLHITSLRGELDNMLTVEIEKGDRKPSASFERLSTMVRTVGAGLVFLDNVAHLFGGNENDRGEVTQFVNLLNRLAGDTGAAVILIGHPPKSAKPGDQAHDFSGSTAWLNAVRSQFFMEHDLETDLRRVRSGKANYAAKGDVASFRWHNFAFVRDEDLPEDIAKSLSETIKMNGENSAFMRCLTICAERKRAVSHVPGSNYAPKIFAGMIEGKGIPPSGYAAAMERLLHLGEIELAAPLWQDKSRHWKQGIKAVGKCGDPSAATPCGDPR